MPEVVGTLVLPKATAPAQTAEGSVVWDTDDDELTVGTGAAAKRLASGTRISALTAATAGDQANEFPINEAGTTKKLTAAQLAALIPTLLGAIGTFDLAIANTETVVVSKTFAANELTADMTWLFRAQATRAGTTSASEVIRIRIGTTTLTGNIAATLTPPVSTLAVPIVIEGMVTIVAAGGSGTARGSLERRQHLAAVTITSAIASATATVAVDTTAANQKIELTFISGNAANTYTFRNSVMHRVK